MYKRKHTLALCCQADGGHRPWGLMSKILADMPWKKGFVVLLHHTYIFFYTWLLSLFSPLSIFLSPCWAHIPVPQDPQNPPPSPTLHSTHQMWAPAYDATVLPPTKHKQNLLPSSVPEQRALPLSFLSALSVLSSFSLTISCDGLRTHQLLWV